MDGANYKLSSHAALFFGSPDHNLIEMNKFKQKRLLLDKFF